MQAALTDALGAQVRGVVVGVEPGAEAVATDEVEIDAVAVAAG
jgi:hypothetical protein